MPEEKSGSVPELRFPEFRDCGPWEVKRLGDVYRFQPTNSWPRDRLNYDSGTIKNIHYGDIHKGFSSTFRIGDESVPFIEEELATSLNKEAFCKPGDVVFADASEDVADIGKAIEIVEIDGQKLVSGLHTILASQIDRQIITGFGAFLFASTGIRSQIQQRSQGAKVLGISKSQLADVKLAFPRQQSEQQEIADCLGALDDLIRAEGEQVEALKRHKRGLMQQLFLAPGETTPSLRFPEFRDCGPWELKRLGDLEESGIVQLGRGNVISQKDMNLHPGKYPVYSSSTKNDGEMGRYGHFMFDDEMITWSIDGGGDFFYRPRHKFSVTNVCGFMRLDNGRLDCRFAASQLQRSHALKSFDYVAKAHPSVIRELYTLGIPSLREQQKIADCLIALDDWIRAQGEAIEALKRHKQGLMQKLFPRKVA